jgi:hypothetical protein
MLERPENSSAATTSVMVFLFGDIQVQPAYRHSVSPAWRANRDNRPPGRRGTDEAPY